MYKVKLMPVIIIQIELIQYWHEETDEMNFTLPFGTFYNSGDFCLGFFFVGALCGWIFLFLLFFKVHTSSSLSGWSVEMEMWEKMGETVVRWYGEVLPQSRVALILCCW